MGGVTLAIPRWTSDPFYGRILRGQVLDVGGTMDPFGQFKHLFPDVTEVWTLDALPCPAGWAHGGYVQGDLEEGVLVPATVEQGADVVIASHVLEHVRPEKLPQVMWALERWVKPGGHLIVIVPSWTMYERKLWPAQWNGDHKTAWEMSATFHEPVHVRALALFPAQTRIVRALTLEDGFLPDVLRDQTADGTCECGLELVTRRI